MDDDAKDLISVNNPIAPEVDEPLGDAVEEPDAADQRLAAALVEDLVPLFDTSTRLIFTARGVMPSEQQVIDAVRAPAACSCGSLANIAAYRVAISQLAHVLLRRWKNLWRGCRRLRMRGPRRRRRWTRWRPR